MHLPVTIRAWSAELLCVASCLFCVGVLTLGVGRPAHDPMRLSQVLPMLLAAWCAARSRGDIVRQVRPVAWLFVAWFALALLSSAQAAVPSAALREVALLLGLMGVAFAVAAVVRQGLPIWLAHALIASALAYAIASTALFVAGVLLGDVASAWYLAPGFDNPRFLNHAQTLELPLLLAALHASRGRWRVLAGLALAMQIALLLYTRGRATQIALVVAPILVCALRLPGSRRFLRDSVLSGLAGGVLFLVMFVPLSLWVGGRQLWTLPGDVGSMAIRMRLWDQALQAIASSPWLGLGPMHYSSLRVDQGGHPHNVYLQWAAEYGVPAAVLMVLGLGRLLWRAMTHLRTHDAHAQPFALAAFVACVAALIDASFSGNFVMPVSQLWLALAFGLLIGHLPVPYTRGESRSWAVVGWLLLAVQVGYAVVTLLDWQSAPPHLGESLVLPLPGLLLPPRHWLHGWF